MLRPQTDEPQEAETLVARPIAARRLTIAERFAAARRFVSAWFRDRPPGLAVFLLPLFFISVALYVRSFWTNYIFDEQEALLANPYVNGHSLRFWEAFKCDFWGLAPDRSIGSYRPIPNLIWRSIWQINTHPWALHLVNLLVHAINGALIARIAWRWTNSQRLAWLAGIVFVTSAVITEAVSGVVGLADVLGGLGVLLAVNALGLRLYWMPVAVLATTLLALFSKESSIAAVVVVPCAALISAPLLHDKRPLTAARALLALLATAAALVLYVQLRKHLFPAAIPEALAEPLSADQPWIARVFHEFLRWFGQPRLPQDSINNPLLSVSFPERIATALRIYLSGLGQVVFPWTLSGDYSFQAELPALRARSPSSVIGGIFLIAPPLMGMALWLKSLWRERPLFSSSASSGASTPLFATPPSEAQNLPPRISLLVALALIWLPTCYFPQSNIPILLPTIRADRFWYLPIVGSSWLLAALLNRLLTSSLRWPRFKLGLWVTILFLSFQAMRARIHALSFNSDLDFWRVATHAVPNSTKARLNYGVMLGARGDSEGRLRETARAIELAPQWAMAHIYYGDALCRLHRSEEAWPYYHRGFELGPNEPNLIALALQCLWDNGALKPHQAELSTLAAGFAGSWLAYFTNEIIARGEENGGVEKKYRPRGYDEAVRK